MHIRTWQMAAIPAGPATEGCHGIPAGAGSPTGCLLPVAGLAASARSFDGVASATDFERTVLALHGRQARWRAPFPTLRAVLGADGAFWRDCLPEIVGWAEAVEGLFPAGVPHFRAAQEPGGAGGGGGAEVAANLARQGLRFTRPEATALLCAAFLCALPGRDLHDERPGFAPFSFLRLFAEPEQPYLAAKLVLLLRYFRRLPEAAAGTGVVALQRHAVAVAPAWVEVGAPVCELAVDWVGGMEDCADSVQVGMSNRYVGGAPGGVLATGKMQEPALFCCRPELVLALLVCPALGPGEAILVSGARQFGASAGVGLGLRAREAGGEPGEPTAAERARAAGQCQLVVDAIDFRKPEAPPQFSRAAVDRELRKLYAGFSLAAGRKCATGNWCCDAFGGDKQLKLAVQLVAASAAGVPRLSLYPNAFEGDETTPDELPVLDLPAGTTAGSLYKALLGFLVADEPAEAKAGGLFGRLQHSWARQ
jgi:hypothetical protein